MHIAPRMPHNFVPPAHPHISLSSRVRLCADARCCAACSPLHIPESPHEVRGVHRQTPGDMQQCYPRCRCHWKLTMCVKLLPSPLMFTPTSTHQDDLAACVYVHAQCTFVVPMPYQTHLPIAQWMFGGFDRDSECQGMWG
jgi:hypothetical protein